MLLPGGGAGATLTLSFKFTAAAAAVPLLCCCEGDTGESLKFGQNTSKEKQQAVLTLLSNIAAWIDR